MMPYIIILKVIKFHKSTRNRFATAGEKPVGLTWRKVHILILIFFLPSCMLLLKASVRRYVSLTTEEISTEKVLYFRSYQPKGL